VAGISGVGVGVASAGALLIYAGLRGQNPLSALREIASGHPGAIPDVSGSRGITATIPGGPAILGGAVGYPPLLQAVQAFRGDRYSQARRWQPGYSDCSSFPGKGFKALGITPPGASTTLEYLAWSHLRKIPSAYEAGPGDLLISTSHMAVVIDRSSAIGQQNPTRNVATGSWADIMYGSGSYGIYRYTATAGSSHPSSSGTVKI
jgi:hypothetical protein